MGQLAQDRQQLVFGLEVEAVGGFIKHQHLGAMHQGPGQQQAPPLAIGELAKGAIGDRIEIQLGQQFLTALPMVLADLLATAQPYRAEETRKHHVAGDHAGAVVRL